MTAPPTFETLVLIPPILDCIVTYLHTIDLLAFSQTNVLIYTSLRNSHAAWRAISFYSPTKPFVFDLLQRSSCTILSSTLTARPHYRSTDRISPLSSSSSDAGPSPPHSPLLPAYAPRTQKESQCLSVDKTLTVLGRMLPLKLYTSIDLSRTLADKHLLRDLLDNCAALKWLTVKDCPRLKLGDLVIAFGGVEKRVVKSWRKECEQRGVLEDGKGAGGEGGLGIGYGSLVAEIMGQMPIIVGGVNNNNSNTHSSPGNSDSLGSNQHQNQRYGTIAVHRPSSAALSSNASDTNTPHSTIDKNLALSRLTHVHTKEVRDGLYRLNEFRDGLRAEVVRAMSKMQDVYTYPDLPQPLSWENGKRPIQLVEVCTDMDLRRSIYNGPGWLERLANSRGDYLFVLCHLMDVRLVHSES